MNFVCIDVAIRDQVHHPLTIFCGSPVWFVSELVGNPEDRFSHGSIMRFIIVSLTVINVFILRIADVSKSL